MDVTADMTFIKINIAKLVSVRLYRRNEQLQTCCSYDISQFSVLKIFFCQNSRKYELILDFTPIISYPRKLFQNTLKKGTSK